MKNISQTVYETVASALNLDVEKLNESDGPKTIPNWDSTKHLEILIELETKLGVTFSEDDFMFSDNIKKIISTCARSE